MDIAEIGANISNIILIDRGADRDPFADRPYEQRMQVHGSRQKTLFSCSPVEHPSYGSIPAFPPDAGPI
jgi:hypothetical protein